MSENINTTASVANIDDTVVAAVDSMGYSVPDHGAIIAAVVVALQEREHTIAEQIIESADNRYGYGSQAKEVVTDAGMFLKPEPVEEEPVVEEAPAAELTTDERLRNIESAVQKLSALALRHFGDNF